MPSDTMTIGIVMAREHRRRYSAEQKLRLVKKSAPAPFSGAGAARAAIGRLRGRKPGRRQCR